MAAVFLSSDLIFSDVVIIHSKRGSAYKTLVAFPRVYVLFIVWILQATPLFSLRLSKKN